MGYPTIYIYKKGNGAIFYLVKLDTLELQAEQVIDELLQLPDFEIWISGYFPHDTQRLLKVARHCIKAGSHFRTLPVLPLQ